MNKASSAIAKLVEAGAAHITVLEGKAPEQKNKTAITIKGNYDAPRRFIEARKHWFGKVDGVKNPATLKDNSFAEINKNNGSIRLYVDETNPNDHYTIVGGIKIGKFYEGLKINAGTFGSPESLSTKLRMMRSIFTNKDVHANLVRDLKNLNVKINKEIDTKDDNRGNRSQLFKQTVESTIPMAFGVKMPVIDGLPDLAFQVDVLLSVNDSGAIVCSLESVDSQEFYDVQTATLMEKEADVLKEYVTVIFV